MDEFLSMVVAPVIAKNILQENRGKDNAEIMWYTSKMAGRTPYVERL